MHKKISLKNLMRLADIDLKSKAYRSALLVGLVLFGLGVLASYIAAFSAVTAREQNKAYYDSQQVASITESTHSKLASYEELVISGAALLKTMQVKSQADWENIYKNLRIPERAPELLGFGFVQHISTENLQGHINTLRNQENPDYEVTPAGTRSEYAVIRYLAPSDSDNQKVLGYDMFSEPIRNQAMRTARDTGEPALSAPVLAKQDEDRPDDRRPQSVLMYYPVYKENRGASQKLSTLLGYTYLIFRAEDIMGKNINSWQKNVTFLMLTDVTGGTKRELFVSGSSTTKAADLMSKNITVLSRSWQITLESSDSNTRGLLDPTAIFIFGMLMSFAIGTLGLLILARRATLMSQMHQREIQKTKDDLLALASHQLRTPATGVRQYLGMLLNGYFGELQGEQAVITQKAFDANDRQLEIIDELLYVAKADAGQLNMNIDVVDIAAITKDVIDASASAAEKKHVSLQLTGKRRLRCAGDKRYITMIVENLISNAIKYSYDGATVKVSVQSSKSSAVVRVSDAGVGIDEKDLPNLFLKFVRIENPLSRSEGGSGLGLFLAQKLAQAHGGNIAVTSVVGKGSTFTVRLPLHQKQQKNVVQLIE